MTKAQKNILSIIVANTLITRGKNKGQLKGSQSCDSFDGRSFKGLIQQGCIEYHDGIFGEGWVATAKGLSIIETN